MPNTATNLTYADWIKRQAPGGGVDQIIEMLTQKNQCLEDIVWKESNQPTSHLVTIRTGLPDVYWRTLNAGTQPSKSTTAQITEGMGILEAWSDVDVEVANLEGDLKQFRLSEAEPFIEKMSQEMMQTIFYGNANLSPEEFNGLAIRYNDLDSDTAQNIIDAGGTGSDNASIWLVSWGDTKVHGIFPKGQNYGIAHDDKGVQTDKKSDGKLQDVYREKWNWKGGIVVKDWRCAARICNIDISNLVAQSSAADLIEKMIEAFYMLPDGATDNAMFYMNRTIARMLHVQSRNDLSAGGGIRIDFVEGKPVTSFLGCKIRICDALTNAEAAVTN